MCPVFLLWQQYFPEILLGIKVVIFLLFPFLPVPTFCPYSFMTLLQSSFTFVSRTFGGFVVKITNAAWRWCSQVFHVEFIVESSLESLFVSCCALRIWQVFLMVCRHGFYFNVSWNWGILLKKKKGGGGGVAYINVYSTTPRHVLHVRNFLFIITFIQEKSMLFLIWKPVRLGLRKLVLRVFTAWLYFCPCVSCLLQQ
jgi:hypothetical protein